jgi:5'-nucleotidase
VDLKRETIGTAAVELVGDRNAARRSETNFGDLICDAMLEQTAASGAQIALMNGGGIRSGIKAGSVSLGQVLEALPFGNTLVVLDLPGSAIRRALDNGVSRVDEGAGRYPQVGGLRFVYNPSRPAGSRLSRVEVGSLASGFRPLDDAATYRLVTNDFMLGGGDDYSALAAGTNVLQLDFLIADVVADYIRAHTPVAPAAEGRISTSS